MLRQYRKFTQTQNQQRIATALEHETDLQAVEDVDPGHFLQAGAIQRMSLVQKRAVGKGDIVGGDGFAIVKAGFRAQVEYHPAAILAVLHAFGDQAVAGIAFIARGVIDAAANHQWLVQLVDTVLQEVAGADRRRALDRVGIEGVEAAVGHQAHGTALWCLGVDPVEVGKAGGVLELAELGVAMAAGQLGVSHLAQQQTDQQGEEVSHQAAVRSMAKHFIFVGTVTACIDRKKGDSGGAGAIILTTVTSYFVKDLDLGRAHFRFGRLG